MSNTENYGFTKYSYATKGWDIGFNQALQSVNDTVESVEAVHAQVSTNLGVLSSRVGLSTESAYQQLGYNLGFDFWQRGTGFTGSTNVPTADLWWKNGNADVTRVAAPSSFNTDYAAQVAKKAGTATAAYIFNAIPFPSKLHNHMRFFRNRAVTVAADVECADASEARVGIFDGVSWTFSSFHTGSGNRERLVVSKTVSLYATGLIIGAFVHGAGTAKSAKFGNVAAALGTYTALAYLPRHSQEDELACRMMFQQINFGNAWGNHPSAHVEQFSVIHPVPMVTQPDAVTVQRGQQSGGTANFSIATYGQYLSTLRAEGATRSTSPFNVSITGSTLSLEVYYGGLGGRCLGSPYAVS